MSILKQVGDSIHHSIKLETDYPTNHPDGKVPILDLKLWVDSRGVIMHEHYMKPVSSKFTVHERSAISPTSKRQILTQDALRILLNCSKDMHWNEKVVHLQKFSDRLQYSGYDAKMRYEIIDSAVKVYQKIRQDEVEGKRPMYRECGWRYEERESAKIEKRSNWYRRGGYHSVVFVPSTPGSSLKKRFDEEIKKSEFKIRVVEKAGRSLKDSFQKSNPFRESNCKRTACPVCTTSGKGRCDQINVTYEVICKQCGEKYIGQTARNAYERGKEHFNNYEYSKGPLWKHCVEKHEATRQQFQMNVMGTFGNDCMLRKITESVRIERENPTMNSKEEWNFVNIPRARAS